MSNLDGVEAELDEPQASPRGSPKWGQSGGMEVHQGKSSLSPTVLAFLGALVFIAAANNVTSKLVYDAYGLRYSFFVNQAVNALYLLGAASCVAVKLWRTDEITPEMRQCSKKYFVIMGFMDALASFLGAMGAVYTPGSLQVLLNQCLIPITMIVSFILLKHTYDLGQIGGAFIIVIGAALAVVPSIIHPFASIRWTSCLAFWAANFPNALSSVCKEFALKGWVVLDVYYLTMWVGLYQTLWTFVFTPIQSLPGFGDFELNTLMPNLYYGAKCTFGIDTYEDDQCSSGRPGLLFLSYVVLNFFYNVVGLFITKHGSAFLASIAYTLQIPFTNVAFAICAIMGSSCEPFTVFSGAGLAVVLCGFSVHTYFDHRAQRHMEKFEEERLSLLGINAPVDDTPDVGNWYHSKLPDFTIGRKAEPQVIPKVNPETDEVTAVVARTF